MNRLRERAGKSFHATILSACFLIGGCASLELYEGSEPARGPVLETAANFDAALKQNQAALRQRRGPQDAALYNIGVILAHPANPRRDDWRAARSFQALVAEHPQSVYVEQAKTWILLLEQKQKLTEERQKVAEERRALSRERELLAEERQKLNYASEKSHRLDVEIEKRRRQSLAR